MPYSVFKDDVAQRKASTSGARHRKNGSKSHKCTMPSDNLTPAQKRKLNVEVVTMNLYKPMEFRDFTKMSTESQREYIQHLKDVFKASKSDIQHMFDISEYQMNAVCRTLGVGPFPRGGKKKHGEDGGLARVPEWQHASSPRDQARFHPRPCAVPFGADEERATHVQRQHAGDMPHTPGHPGAGRSNGHHGGQLHGGRGGE